MDIYIFHCTIQILFIVAQAFIIVNHYSSLFLNIQTNDKQFED